MSPDDKQQEIDSLKKALEESKAELALAREVPDKMSKEIKFLVDVASNNAKQLDEAQKRE